LATPDVEPSSAEAQFRGRGVHEVRKLKGRVRYAVQVSEGLRQIKALSKDLTAIPADDASVANH
jgi:hypothetical protein